MKLTLERWNSPISPLLLASDDEGNLRALEFYDGEERMQRLLRLHYGNCRLEEGRSPDLIKEALSEYFQGNCAALENIRTATGGTEFQRRVWRELRRIPPGCTWTYGRLASVLGRAGAIRAVGAANGANPVCIVVPCHRVIGANGTLTGYAGGLARKKWLLEHEQKFVPTFSFPSPCHLP